MIAVDHLSLYHQANHHNRCLISDLTLAFNKGEFWAILGKNGTGKTTLLHTLAGINADEAGSIKIDQHELNTLDVLTRAQKIALLPQTNEPGLNCTVEQSISYGRYPWHKHGNDYEYEKKIIESAINIMELDLIRHSSIQKISGGELRKVEIATILAQNSDCLMLDEPLNHLDLAFRLKLMRELKHLSGNKVIIMITHDIQYVQQFCTNVLMLLDNGQNICGTTAEVMTDKNLNKMFGMTINENFLKQTYE